MIPVVVVSKEFLEEQARALYDQARAYMNGYEAGLKAASEKTTSVGEDGT